MKLAIVGGGGFRVPLVYRAAVRHAGPATPTVISLTDTSPERLEAIGHVLARIAGDDGRAPRVEVAPDLATALEGADFVFSAIRVGGLEGRVADERVALDLGVLGQETTGPGGLAFGLRTIPAALELAHAVRRHCPDAWFINFTNPAGMITEALQEVLGDRAIGICDSPMGLAARAARAMGAPLEGAAVDYVGLNHLGWLHGLTIDGVDVLPDLVSDPERLATTEEGRLFGHEWIATLGAIPNEYLYYYDFTRDALAAISGAAETRGEFLLRSQSEFYRAVAELPDRALATWDAVRLERNATYMAEARADAARHDDDVEDGGYERVAVELMAALSGGTPAELILNVRNGGNQPGLPPDAVIEVPCRVDAHGPVPLPVTHLAADRLGLAQQVKAVERLTIRASVAGDPGVAVQALALHPLVDSVTVARQLLAGYRQRIPSLDDVFAAA